MVTPPHTLASTSSDSMARPLPASSVRHLARTSWSHSTSSHPSCLNHCEGLSRPSQSACPASAPCLPHNTCVGTHWQTTQAQACPLGFQCSYPHLVTARICAGGIWKEGWPEPQPCHLHRRFWAHSPSALLPLYRRTSGVLPGPPPQPASNPDVLQPSPVQGSY